VKRRELLLASGALGALATARVSAQPKRPRTIGWFSVSDKESQLPTLRAFSASMAKLGHVEGRDFVFEGRWSSGKIETLPALAKELVALKPAVIVTASTAAIDALKKATSTIPIVFASAADPVASAFVASLARPGGNITGIMLRTELHEKLFDLIREITPATRRVALLAHESDPITAGLSDSMQRAAAALRFEMRVVNVARIEEIGRAFAEAAKGGAEAIIVPQYSLFLIAANVQRIGELALKSRMPLFSTWRNFTVRGGLLSYYNDIRDSFARCAVFTDKILRGASPADLPIEQPDRYSLVINMKTADALAIKVPQAMLVRADEVIR
jgi:putative ABC transport system substrate-binding protein